MTWRERARARASERETLEFEMPDALDEVALLNRCHLLHHMLQLREREREQASERERERARARERERERERNRV